MQKVGNYAKIIRAHARIFRRRDGAVGLWMYQTFRSTVITDMSQLDRRWNYFCDYAVMVWVYRFVILQSTVVCKSFQIERRLVSSLDPSTFAFVLVNKGRWKSLKVLEFIFEKSRLLKVVENVRSTFLKKGVRSWKSLWIFRLQLYSWSSSLRFKVDDWLQYLTFSNAVA